MNDKELFYVDQKMAQNEALQTQSQPYDVSQPQSQQYIPPPQPQGYETSQPQSQQYIPPSQPQSQPYQQSETPQPQSYLSSQPQTYQQSQPQSYQSPQTPYINPPVTNDMYQGGLNQSSNNIMSQNQNALLDYYKPFQENTPTSGRLNCQKFLAIILLLSIVTIIDYLFMGYRISNIYILMILITSILNLIVGIWMIILSIKNKTTRNNVLGIISLISLIICILNFILKLLQGYSASGFELIDIIFLIIVTSYNMKCKGCD